MGRQARSVPKELQEPVYCDSRDEYAADHLRLSEEFGYISQKHVKPYTASSEWKSETIHQFV